MHALLEDPNINTPLQRGVERPLPQNRFNGFSLRLCFEEGAVQGSAVQRKLHPDKFLAYVALLTASENLQKDSCRSIDQKATALIMKL